MGLLGVPLVNVESGKGTWIGYEQGIIGMGKIKYGVFWGFMDCCSKIEEIEGKQQVFRGERGRVNFDGRSRFFVKMVVFLVKMGGENGKKGGKIGGKSGKSVVSRAGLKKWSKKGSQVIIKREFPQLSAPQGGLVAKSGSAWESHEVFEEKWGF